MSITPGLGYAGWVTVDEPAHPDPEYLEKKATDIMCAWIESCNSFDEVPAWPLDSRDVTSVDEQNLAHIASELGWSEWDYGRLKLKAFELMETDVYQLIFNGIVGMTDYTPRLEHRQIEALRSVVVKRLTSEDD